MKNVADAAKDVAAVIERHRLHRRRNRHASFQICDDFGVPANRHRERVQTNQLSLPIAKLTLRHNHLARAGFFKWKSTKRCRAAREEALADWQQPIEIVDA